MPSDVDPSHFVAELDPSSSASAGMRPTLDPQPNFPPPEVQATVHRAVESVLNAAELLGTGHRRSVELQLTVGDVDLAIRVEMNGGQVRATFSTDSSDLRSALAREWQAAIVEAPGRALLAPPVFSSGHSSLNPNFSGDTTPQHREPHPPRDTGVVPSSPATDCDPHAEAAGETRLPRHRRELTNAVHLLALA